MLDHLTIQCSDLAASTRFYDTVLAPFGGRRMLDFGVAIGYGVDRPQFWLGGHAFVRDPDGNNVEAVCHRPQ